MFFPICVFLLPSIVGACGVGGASSDYEYIQDPVLTMDLSPPVGWTYFPPKASDTTNVVWYFVGQSNDSVHADQRADAEIYAAMLESLVTANIQVQGVDITNDYASFQVENPVVLPKGAGPLYAKVEAGAVTQTAIGSATSDFVWQPYSKTVKVSLRNVGNTRYVLNIVKNTFMQKLTLNYGARFVGDVLVNKV